MSDRRIVLCSPKSGENVGFVVRLCANFGIEDLVLVEPTQGWRHGARKTACMCSELLARTRVVANLGTALADRTKVFGFTARAGRDREVRDASELATRVTAGDKTAWVFGNEESGLSGEETSLCTELYRIQIPGMQSLNLSHAVALAIFASFSAKSAEAARPEKPHPLLGSAGKARLLERTKRIVGRSGFPVDDFQFVPSVKRLLFSREIQTRDARTLHRLLTHAAYLMDKFASDSERLDDFRPRPRP